MWVILSSLFFIMSMVFLVSEDVFKTRKRYIIYVAFCAILGTSFFLVDALSPVEVYTRTVYTNDYEVYKLNVDSDKLGIVEITEHTPVVPEAFLREKKICFFKGFVE